MSERDDLLARLSAPFPDNAILERSGGGGRSLRYVPGHVIIRRLNDVAGAWDFRIVRSEWTTMKQRNGEVPLFMVTGELTIPGLGTRAGIGVQLVNDNGGEDLAKGAATDALKKAAVSFGVGIDLYGPDLEAGEVAAPSARPAASGQRPANERNGQRTGGGGDRPASDAQRAFIGKLIRQAHMDMDSVAKWCVDHGFTSETMMGQQASQFIDYLKPLAGYEESAR